MNNITAEDIRIIVLTFLNRRLKVLGRGLLSDLPDDYDLLRSGVIDSLDLVELLAAVVQQFAREVDFAELDPDKMTIVGPLCTFVSEQLAKSI